MAIGFGHFCCPFRFSLLGEEVCFGLGFDGFGVLSLSVEGGFGFFGCAEVWSTGKNVWLILAVTGGLTSCLRVLSLFVQDTLGILGVGEEFGFSVLVGTVAFAVCNFIFGEELGFSSLLGGFFGDGCFNQVRSSHSLEFLLVH